MQGGAYVVPTIYLNAMIWSSIYRRLEEDTKGSIAVMYTGDLSRRERTSVLLVMTGPGERPSTQEAFKGIDKGVQPDMRVYRFQCVFDETLDRNGEALRSRCRKHRFHEGVCSKRTQGVDLLAQYHAFY